MRLFGYDVKREGFRVKLSRVPFGRQGKTTD